MKTALLIFLFCQSLLAQTLFVPNGSIIFSTNGGTLFTAPVQADPSLIVWMKFDENGGTNTVNSGMLGGNYFYNYSSNSLTSVLYWGLGYIGNSSLSTIFNGSLALGTSSSVNFGTGDFTISAAIANSRGGTAVAVGKFSGTGDDYFLGVLSGNYAVSVGTTTVSTPFAVQPGVFKIITGVRKSGEMWLYADGLLVASNACTDSASPGGNLVVGDFGDMAGFPWFGCIDDVRIYNRALSALEVSTLTANINFTQTNTTGDLMYFPVKNHSPTNLVQYVGGHGEDCTYLEADPIKHNLIYALLTNGWAVMAGSGGISSWGNASAIAAHTNAFNWAVGVNPNFRTNVLWSQSMGGLPGLNIMTTSTNYHRWYGIYPACSLSNMCFNPAPNGVPFSNEIMAAYGASPATFLAQTAGSDPMTYTTNLFGSSRYRLIGSLSDSTVGWSGNEAVFTNRLVGLTSTNSVGDHGDDSNFNPPIQSSDFLNFINSP